MPMPVVDTRGRTTLELMGIATGTPGGPVTPPGLRRTLPVSLALLANAGGRRTILPGFGADATEYDAGLRREYDCTDVVRVRLQGWVGRSVGDVGAVQHVGASGSRFVLAASVDGGATWHALDGTGAGPTALATAGPALPLDTLGWQATASVTLPPALRRVLLFTLFTRGGDAATRPWVGNVAVDCWGDEARPTSGGCPVVFEDSFEDADLADVDTRWAVTGGLPDGTATWSLATDLVAHGGQSLALDLVGYGGGAGALVRDHSIGGLVPNAAYVVTAQCRVSALVPTTHVSLGASHGTGFLTDVVDVAGAWVTLTVNQTAGTSGDLTVRLGFASDFDALATIGVRWDAVRVTEACGGESSVNVWPNADFSRADWDAYGAALASGDPVTDYVSADGGLDGGASLRVISDLTDEEIPVVIPEAQLTAEGGAGTWTLSGMIRLTAGLAKVVTPWGATFTTPASWRADESYHAFALTGAWSPTATDATRTFGLRVEGTTPRGNAHFDKLMLARASTAQPFVEDVP